MKTQMFSTSHFKIAEFLIDGIMPNEDIRRRIYYYHMLPLERIRKVYKKPILISKRSGFRPVSWELSHGRSGSSQHTFKERGAVDVVCDSVLLELLFLSGEYNRIIYYPNEGFAHCDYVTHVSYDTVLYQINPKDNSLVFIKAFNF